MSPSSRRTGRCRCSAPSYAETGFRAEARTEPPRETAQPWRSLIASRRKAPHGAVTQCYAESTIGQPSCRRRGEASSGESPEHHFRLPVIAPLDFLEAFRQRDLGTLLLFHDHEG